MYTATKPWRQGHYINTKGKIVPLNKLKVNSYGNYPRTAIKRINNIKADFRLLNRTLTGLNVVTTTYDAYKLWKEPNIENGVALTIDGVSYMFWEVGVISAGIQGMIWAASGETQQIQTNIMNNENPLNNVYVPGLGTTYYSPF